MAPRAGHFRLHRNKNGPPRFEAIHGGHSQSRCYFKHGSDALESKECLIRSPVEVPLRVSNQSCERRRAFGTPVEAVQHREFPCPAHFEHGSVVACGSARLSRAVQVAGGIEDKRSVRGLALGAILTEGVEDGELAGLIQFEHGSASVNSALSSESAGIPGGTVEVSICVCDQGDASAEGKCSVVFSGKSMQDGFLPEPIQLEHNSTALFALESAFEIATHKCCAVKIAYFIHNQARHGRATVRAAREAV